MSTLRLPPRRIPLRRSPLVCGAFAALGLVAAVLGVNAGQFDGRGITPAQAFIIDQLLLPRVLTALLAGGALALAGAVFQSVTRNPLGSPDVLGFTQGAATGALVAVTWFGGERSPSRRAAGSARSAAPSWSTCSRDEAE